MLFFKDLIQFITHNILQEIFENAMKDIIKVLNMYNFLL